MVDFSGISLDDVEIISFLKRDLRLKEIYRELICQKIILKVAEEYGLIVDAAEIHAELERLRAAMGFDSATQLVLWLYQQKTTLHEFEKRIHEKLMTQRLSRELFAQQIHISFAQNPESLDQIVLYKIVVPYQALAQELFYRIEEEEISFYEAAHFYDIDERRRLHCGYEGMKQRSMFAPEIADRLFSARVGEVIEPIQTAENIYELFLVDDFLPFSLTSPLYEEILNQMLQKWLDNKVDAYINQNLET